jgi:hypothetical protein
MSDRQRLTPPQTTMWPSPPSLSLSISSAVSPAAMVVLVQSAVLRVREKTTLRPAFRMAPRPWQKGGAMDADQIEERLLYELRGRRHEDVFSGASAIDLV